MKKETIDKNFDMNLIKNPEKKRIVWNALNYMQLTLTPLLYINYLRAISHTHYKVAMQILRTIDSFAANSTSDAEFLESAQVSSEAGRILLEAILYDLQHCSKNYHGGFIFGIINAMDLKEDTEAYETLRTFIINYFNRVNDYVCNNQ